MEKSQVQHGSTASQGNQPELSIEQYQHLLNYRPKLGVSNSIMNQNSQVAATYSTVHNKNTKVDVHQKLK